MRARCLSLSAALLFVSFSCLLCFAIGKIAAADSIPANSAAPDEAAAQAIAKKTGHPATAGPLDPNTKMQIELVLALRNQAGLSNLLLQLADPRSAQHGKYLTSEEFATRYGPSPIDMASSSDFLVSGGFTVLKSSRIEGLMQAKGTCAQVERAFKVKMYRSAAPSGRIYYSTDVAPTLPAGVVTVLGLNTGAELDPFFHLASPQIGFHPDTLHYSGNAGLTPADVKSIYKMGSVGTESLGGNGGQALGLFEQGTYTASDIYTFFSTYVQFSFGQPGPQMVNIGVDGYNTNSAPGPAAPEATLDLDMFATLAPYSEFYEVFENNDQTATAQDFISELIDSFKAMATVDQTQHLPRPSVISVSYGISELWYTTGWNPSGPADAVAENQALAQLAAQGQTVCASSGDAGAWTDESHFPTEAPNTSDPASEPYVTAVRGTDLTDTTTPPLQYVSETSWYDALDAGRGYFGTGGGGGISMLWPLPYWQAGVFSTSTNPQGSTTMRNVPDISLYGDYDTGGYDVYFSNQGYNGAWYSINGTSASSPLWAAYLVNVNEQRGIKHLPPLGFVNPALYNIGTDFYYAGDYNDIADGSTNGYYAAVAGYDNSTGWGSLNGANLLNQLSLHATWTTVTSTSPTSAVAGQPITFTATITSSDGGSPTGNVIFNGIVPGTSIQVPLVGNTATCSGSFAAPGSYQVTAWYSGDTNDQISVGNYTQTVVSKATTTTLTANPPAGIYGKPVTLTATVAAVAPGSGVPTGTVTFDTVSTNGKLIPLGTGTLNGSGVATLAVTTLPMGTSTLEAVYGGDSSSLGSNGTTTVAVGWYFTFVFEEPPTNVVTTTTVPNGPAPTVSWQTGYDQVSAICANGGSTFNYSSNAQATFNWYVEWLPTIQGQAPPKTAQLTFTRYAANYGSVSGSTAPGSIGSLVLTSNASSTWGQSATCNLTITASNSGASQTVGTTTLLNLGTWTSAPVALQPSGGAALAIISIPVQALATIGGTANFSYLGGGGGGSAISTAKEVAGSATFNF